MTAPQSRGGRSPASTRRAQAVALGIALASAAGAAACDDERRGYDGFPISVDTRGGALVAVAEAAGSRLPVAVDILAPVTSLDLVGDDDGEGAERVLVDLHLRSPTPDGDSVDRAHFRDTPVLDDAICPEPPCEVGAVGSAAPVEGVVGADVLGGGHAVRIDFVASALTFFPDIAGRADDHALECDAVMSDPFGGGGTLLVDGAEFGYAGRRPVVSACLAPDPVAPAEATDRTTGVDTVLALSTGVGQSVLAASAWDRVADAIGAAPAANLPRGLLLLPSGPLEVAVGEIPRMALVGDLGAESEERGPCREFLISRLMADDLCRRDADRPCACPDGDRLCPAAAAVELHRPLAVAVIDDGSPLLQALRDELRPALPELDGILGADALAPTRLDLDYPNGRLLWRCLDPAGCTGRPQLDLEEDSLARREAIAACRGDALPDAGVVP